MDKKDSGPKAVTGSTAGTAFASRVTRRTLLKGAAGAGIAATAMYVAPSLRSTGARKAYAAGSPAIPPSHGTWVMTNGPVNLLDGNGNPTGIMVMDLQVTGTLGGDFGASGSVSLRTPDGAVDCGSVSGSTDTAVGGPLGDPDFDTREQVPTEILSMELTGPVGGLGTVTVHESPTMPSTGELEENSNSSSGNMDFPAESFFDIFVEIDLPGFGPTLHNSSPIHVEATVNP